MGSNLHKDLTDSQIHVPKGFSTASNSTVLTKDSGGSLVWATDSHSGITDKRLNMSFGGETSAKTVGEYGRYYSPTYSGFIFGGGRTHWTGTITPIMATSSACWVVPADCTIESLTIRSTSTNPLLACSIFLYIYRYDCVTAPTTITEFVFTLAMDRTTIDANEILCKDITSFTTSALLAGDLIVQASAVEAVTTESFLYSGSMLVKLT